MRVGIFWSLIAVGLIFIVVTMLFKLLELADSIQVALMLTLVLVTWHYARSAREQAEANKKMAEEMMEQRYDAIIPVIDIQVLERSVDELLEQAYGAKGRLPKKMRCTYRNVGLGPATNISCLIGDLEGDSLREDFGTLAVGEKSEEIGLFLTQKDGRNALVVNYSDIYGRLLESSRDVSVETGSASFEIGPLRVRKLAAKE